MLIKEYKIFHKTVRMLGCVALLAGWAAVSHAQRMPGPSGNMGKWDYLGRAQVDGRMDHDRVNVSGSPRPYRAIQLEVQNADVEFRRVTVFFQNGSNQVLQLRNRVPAGGRTRALDLSGNRRNIRSIEFWYGRGNWSSRRPTVIVYGRI